jgi:hypothetical protein
MYTKISDCYVRSEVLTAVTMKNAVFWDTKNPDRTSQETHYFSATDLSQLMLCKIWGSHSGDYDECRLLRYKNPSSNLTGDTLLLRYRVYTVNGM